MKRIVAMMTALALLLALAALPGAAADELRYVSLRVLVIPAGTEVRSRVYGGAETEILAEDYVCETNWSHTAGYYRFKNENGEYRFVKKQDVGAEFFPQKPAVKEYWAEEEQPLYSFPDPVYGKVIGTLRAEEAYAVTADAGDYVAVSLDGRTGYALRSGLVPPGGTGEGAYYILVNLHDFTLTVFRADGEGGHTEEKIKETLVCIGKQTTPTPTGMFKLGKNYEVWHQFGPSHAPYTIPFTLDRWMHGELCSSNDRTDLRQDRMNQLGTAKSGGCIRMSTDVAQWIFYHCAPGTVVEVVKGQ